MRAKPSRTATVLTSAAVTVATLPGPAVPLPQSQGAPPPSPAGQCRFDPLPTQRGTAGLFIQKPFAPNYDLGPEAGAFFPTQGPADVARWVAGVIVGGRRLTGITVIGHTSDENQGPNGGLGTPGGPRQQALGSARAHLSAPPILDAIREEGIPTPPAKFDPPIEHILSPEELTHLRELAAQHRYLDFAGRPDLSAMVRDYNSFPERVPLGLRRELDALLAAERGVSIQLDYEWTPHVLTCLGPLPPEKWRGPGEEPWFQSPGLLSPAPTHGPAQEKKGRRSDPNLSPPVAETRRPASIRKQPLPHNDSAQRGGLAAVTGNRGKHQSTRMTRQGRKGLYTR